MGANEYAENERETPAEHKGPQSGGWLPCDPDKVIKT